MFAKRRANVRNLGFCTLYKLLGKCYKNPPFANIFPFRPTKKIKSPQKSPSKTTLSKPLRPANTFTALAGRRYISFKNKVGLKFHALPHQFKPIPHPTPTAICVNAGKLGVPILCKTKLF
jgi:hypothetical protein